MRLPTILILSTCFAVIHANGEAPAKNTKVHYKTDKVVTESSNEKTQHWAIKRSEVRKPASPVKLEKFKRTPEQSPSQQNNQTETPVSEGKLRDLKEEKVAESIPQTVKGSKQSAID